MRELPLFPRAIRLVLYAGTAVAAMASAPSLIAHLRHGAIPLVDEDATSDSDATTKPSHVTAGSILIQPVGADAAKRRQAELAALQAKLAATATAK